MKRSFFFGVLAISLYLNYQSYFNSSDVRVSQKYVVHSIEQKQQIVQAAPIRKIENFRKPPSFVDPPSLKEKYTRPKTVNQEDIKQDQINATYDHYVEKFEQEVKAFFKMDLGLTDSDYELYQDIKTSYYEKKQEAFNNEVMDNLKDGDIYVPTQEELIDSSRIMSEHLDQLRSLLGESNYKEYMYFVRKFNQDAVRNSSPTDPAFMVEF